MASRDVKTSISIGVLLLSLLGAACGAEQTLTPTVPSPTATSQPTPAPTPLNVEWMMLDNPVAGFTVAYPKGWVYSADVEQTYIAENDAVLQSGLPGEGAMFGVVLQPLSGLESALGHEASVGDVFQWVAANLFRARGALIGATSQRRFGAREGLGAQVMWIDSESQGRVQGYLATSATEKMAVVVLATALDSEWNATRPVFDEMLNRLEIALPGVYGDSSRGAIAAGERAETELTAGWSDHWTYSSPGKEYVGVSVDAVGDRWDPYVEVYGDGGWLVADDDNGGSGYNARVGTVWLASSGTYTIYVSGFAGAGLYEIEVERVSPLGGELEEGRVAEETLDAPADWHVWTFQGQGGEAVSLTMSPAEAGLNPALDLHLPDGRLGGTSREADGGEAQILGFVLPQEGQYRAIARSAFDTVGAYRLSLQRLQPVGGGPLAPGEVVTGIILPQGVHRWTFTGDADDLVTISMGAPAGDLAGRLTLVGPDGAELASSGSDGTIRDARIDGIVLRTGGVYTVEASILPGAAGDYWLAVEPVTIVGTLNYGDTVTGTLSPGGQDNWLFEGQAGDRVTVTVTTGAGALDSHLGLHSLDATQLAADDSGGGVADVQIGAYALPESDTYRIAVTGRAGQDEGEYGLTLSVE